MTSSSSSILIVVVVTAAVVCMWCSTHEEVVVLWLGLVEVMLAGGAMQQLGVRHVLVVERCNGDGGGGGSELC